MVAYIKIIYIPIVKLLLRFWWFLLFGVIYIAFIKGILEESSLNGKMGSTDNDIIVLIVYIEICPVYWQTYINQIYD